MTERYQFALVGLFVLVLGTALVAGILWLGAGGPQPAYKHYRIYLTESVYGLSKDSAVTYHGVNVGRVQRIELDPDNPQQVRLLLQILADTPIYEDTIASLEVQVLTGLAHINLEGGKVTAAALQARPGQEYPVITSRTSLLGSWSEGFSSLLERLTGITERIDRLFADPELKGIVDELKATLSNSRDASDHLRRILGQLDQNLVPRLPSLVEQLQDSIASVERMADRISSTANTLERQIDDRGSEVEQFTAQALPEATIMVVELRQAAENLRRFSEELERHPEILMRGAPQPRPGPGE